MTELWEVTLRSRSWRIRSLEKGYQSTEKCHRWIFKNLIRCIPVNRSLFVVSFDKNVNLFTFLSQVIFLFLDQASNQALKEEINRLNTKIDNLNAESRSLNRSYDERGQQIRNLRNQLEFCEMKDNLCDNRKWLKVFHFCHQIFLKFFIDLIVKIRLQPEQCRMK